MFTAKELRKSIDSNGGRIINTDRNSSFILWISCSHFCKKGGDKRNFYHSTLIVSFLKNIRCQYFFLISLLTTFRTQTRNKFLEVSTIWINMWEFWNLLKAIPFVSSCYLHACCLNLSRDHQVAHLVWNLDELYINSWFFYFIKNYKSVSVPKTPENTIMAIKWFLVQMMNIKFKKNFILYFEDKDTFFSVWNFIYRHKCLEKDFRLRLKSLKRHISRSFTLNSKQVKGFKHELNLFSIEDIWSCIGIQRRTSLFFKCKELWVWNCWVTNTILTFCLLNLRYFSELIIKDWVVQISNRILKSFECQISSVKFIRWWFVYWDNLFLESIIISTPTISYDKALGQKKLIDFLLKNKISEKEGATCKIVQLLKKRINADRLINIELIDWDFWKDSAVGMDSEKFKETSLDIVFGIDKR